MNKYTIVAYDEYVRQGNFRSYREQYNEVTIKVKAKTEEEALKKAEKMTSKREFVGVSEVEEIK